MSETKNIRIRKLDLNFLCRYKIFSDLYFVKLVKAGLLQCISLIFIRRLLFISYVKGGRHLLWSELSVQPSM
jgi:hypothetical protein